MRHLIAALIYGVFGLIFVVSLQGTGGSVSWLGLGVCAFFASKAVFEVQLHRARSAMTVDAAMLRAFRMLGQGYCVTGGVFLVSAVTREHNLGWFGGPAFCAGGAIYWLVARAGARGSKEFPWQPSEGPDIYPHLTTEELRRLKEHWSHIGPKVVLWISLPLMTVIASFFLSAWLGFSGIAVFVLYCVVVVRPMMQAMQQSNKELLCESEWAREHGYTAETLGTFSFPWSR